MRALRISFLLVAVLYHQLSNAQQPQPIFRHYTVDDGLPSSEIYHVIQDAKGYMWFATDIGVSRFDGYEFQNFSFTEGLPDNTIFNIYEDYQGRIWFVSFSGRLSFFRDGFISTYKYNEALEKELTNLYKGSFYVDKEDAIYIGTSTSGFIKINNDGEITRYAADSPYAIRIIYQDSSRVFVCSWTSKVLASWFEIIRESDTTHVEVVDFDPRTNFQCVLLKNNDLVFTSGRVATYIKQQSSTKNYALSHDALSIMEDRDENIWVGTYQGGVLYYDKGLSHKATRRYLEGLSVTSILEDTEGGLWFTTLENGLYYLPVNKYLTYNEKTGMDGQKVICLASDSRNTLFAGLRSGALYYINDSVSSKIQLGKHIRPDIITMFYDKARAKLWVGANSTDFTVDQSGVVSLEYNRGSNVIIKGVDGSIWMGNAHGLMQIKNKNIVYSSRLHQESFRVSSIHEDGQGTLWVGNLHGLWKFKDSAFISAHDSNPLLRYRITDIDEIDGNLCLATRGAGVLILHKDSIIQINYKVGLASDNVNDIFIDGSDLWLATNRGVNKISITEHDDFDCSISSYTKLDGLASDEVNQVIKFRGFIWAATNKGLTFFDPNEIDASTQGPRIYIEGISIMDEDTGILDLYDLPFDQNKLTIHYTGLSYKEAGQIRYRLRMAGIDSSWIMTQNTSIRYTTIPPGSYTFQVLAMNSAGQWSEKAASFSLIIRPPFWATWWFKLGIVLCVAGAIYVFFKIRILTYNRDVVRELMIALHNIFRKVDYLVVKIGSGLVRINVRSILWIKAADNYVEIHTEGQKYLVRSTLDMMNKELPSTQNFLKVHRSYIINLSKVHSVEKNKVKIDTEIIPVSESYKHNLPLVKEHLLLLKK